MNLVTSMILRRMRAPLLLLITVYGVSILGMVLIPGVDDQGNVWHMSFFHAFYFVSYTATTIGFGEIPYPLSDGQRFWALIIVYISVISWFYALGKVIALIQDKTFRSALIRSRFKRNVDNLNRPFYLICGFGETGAALVKELSDEHIRSVVIERDEDHLNELILNEMREFVPSITGDASKPDNLELAGVRNKHCRGVMAVTASDKTNLKIAITSKLLHPDVPVACRSEYKDFEENMLSFGTEHIINPFETFGEIFELAMHSSALHLIYDWLTGAPDSQLTDPIELKRGHWILCGYGRFGQNLYSHLRANNESVTIIDPSYELRDQFRKDRTNDNYQFIVGHGIDQNTLRIAGMEHAAGIVAGSDNDSNNLSIIMTARSINADASIVARQNLLINEALYNATKADMIMRPRELIARKLRVVFLTPLLLRFLKLAGRMDTEWANITVSRLTAVVGEARPHLWTVLINQVETPAIAKGLEYGRSINIGHMIHSPVSSMFRLDVIPLLLVRDDHEILLPDEDVQIKAFDRILFCGVRDVKHKMEMTLKVMSSLNHAMTLTSEPESWVWRKLRRHLNKVERRRKPR